MVTDARSYRLSISVADFPLLSVRSDQLSGCAANVRPSCRTGIPITTYAGPAAPTVEKVAYAGGAVWLDKAQTAGFRGVPEPVWNFHIGGYQVCDKWLKDRKGRALSAEDIEHYQRVVVALNETMRLMGEIDAVIEDHGGWPIR